MSSVIFILKFLLKHVLGFAIIGVAKNEANAAVIINLLNFDTNIFTSIFKS